jgi:hypothetical protein
MKKIKEDKKKRYLFWEVKFLTNRGISDMRNIDEPYGFVMENRITGEIIPLSTQKEWLIMEIFESEKIKNKKWYQFWRLKI